MSERGDTISYIVVDVQTGRVTLDWYELSVAAHVGQMRRVESMRRGCTRADGTTPEWNTDVEGAAAEMAVAKLLGRYWSGSVNAFHDPDVGIIGVRHTTRPDGKLIVRDRDKDDVLYVLVTGSNGSYTIHGGIMGADARALDEYRRNPNGWGDAWFVPQSELAPLTDLTGVQGGRASAVPA